MAVGVFALRFWVQLVAHVDGVIARCATSDTSRVFDADVLDELFLRSVRIVQEAYLEEVNHAARSEIEYPASARVCSVFRPLDLSLPFDLSSDLWIFRLLDLSTSGPL